MDKPTEGTIVKFTPTGVVTRTAEDFTDDGENDVIANLHGVPFTARLDEVEVTEGAKHLRCQRCQSERILSVDGSVPFGFDSISVVLNYDADPNHDFSPPNLRALDRLLPFLCPHPLSDDGVTSISFVICLECGQMQGDWPWTLEWSEPIEDDKEAEDEEDDANEDD